MAMRGPWTAWSLCDRDVRDHFRQSRQAPYRGVEPVWRAVNVAIPLAGKRHHLRLELVEAAAMQHATLFIEQRDRFGPHRLAARGRHFLDADQVRLAITALMHTLGGLLHDL